MSKLVGSSFNGHTPSSGFGEMTIRGGTSGASRRIHGGEPDRCGSPEAVEPQSDYFDPTIEVSATGGPDVSSFSATIATPEPFRVLSTNMKVETEKDLEVAWTPTTSPTIKIVLRDHPIELRATYARCEVPNTGRFAVPWAILEQMNTANMYGEIMDARREVIVPERGVVLITATRTAKLPLHSR